MQHPPLTRSDLECALDDGYTVLETPLGLIIHARNGYPVSHMPGIAKLAQAALGAKEADLVIEMGIGTMLGATLVICTRKGAARWRTAVDVHLDGQNLSGLERYRRGYDRGQAADTIAAVLHPDGWDLPNPGTIPHDADDLGRCARLLALLGDPPDAWKKLSAAVPEWKLYGGELPDLVAGYRSSSMLAAKPREVAMHAISERMRALRGVA